MERMNRRRSSLILASASPRRRELLGKLRLRFKVIPSEAEEVICKYLTPAELVQRNAWAKAESVAKQHRTRLVLGADTIVCLGGRIFGKPRDIGEARRMLRALQGKTHWVVTGVCLRRYRPHYVKLFAEVTRVTFRSLAPSEINHYLELIQPLDKAGAYAIQEHSDRLLAKLEGSYSNVVGLPLERLRDVLALDA
jgi:septum formation protein